MSLSLFPIHPNRITPEFKTFVMKGVANIVTPACSYLALTNHLQDPSLKEFWISLGLGLAILSVYFWWISLYNFLRYTNFLFRLFKWNPFHDEQNPQMLVMGVSQGELVMSPEPDFYELQEEYYRHWRLVKDIWLAIWLFPWRLLLYVLRRGK